MSPSFVLIMGVSGSGKSTIGERIAAEIDALYIEGDELHPPENIAKMSSGTPLQDKDRWPWFDRIIEASKKETDRGKNVLVACSALKAAYRDYLFAYFASPCILFLEGSIDVIDERMRQRNHFMPASLLQSQFETLERPDEHDDEVLVLHIEEPVDTLVKTATDWLRQK